MTITDFLLARIAEDEAAATNWSRFEVRDGIPGSYGIKERVLAEASAKRAIVEVNLNATPNGDDWAATAWHAMCCLATVYADHPDYRDEWRP